jgi:hypothetical protein
LEMVRGVPKETKPELASKAWAGAPFSSRGGDGDHRHGGAVLSPADRLASINSCPALLYTHYFSSLNRALTFSPMPPNWVSCRNHELHHYGQ